EVVLEMAHDVAVVATGGKDVDEPEELRFEPRMRERPVEHALAPPAQMEDARRLRGARGRDGARELLHLGLGRRAHDTSVVPGRRESKRRRATLVSAPSPARRASR